MLERFEIITDTQATYVVTFEFKGTVFAALSVALLVIKCISVWCITLLSDQGL